MAAPRIGDYIVVHNGVGVVTNLSKTHTEYVPSYSRRDNPETIDTKALAPIGERAWKARGTLIWFRVAPSKYPEYGSDIQAKSIADAGAKFKRLFGTKLFKFSKTYVMKSKDWVDLTMRVNTQLANMAGTDNATKWLSVKILGYR